MVVDAEREREREREGREREGGGVTYLTHARTCSTYPAHFATVDVSLLAVRRC